MKAESNQKLALATGAAGALAMFGVIALAISQPAAATAEFAYETGQPCGVCHTSAQGGGALTPVGEKFKANGNKMPK